MGHGLLVIEASRSHSDTSHSVELLWTSDQPDAETSTWQHITFTKYKHPCSGIWTRNPSKRAAPDTRLRLQGHWDRHENSYHSVLIIVFSCMFSGLACLLPSERHPKPPQTNLLWWMTSLCSALKKNAEYYLPGNILKSFLPHRFPVSVFVDITSYRTHLIICELSWFLFQRTYL